MGVLDIVSDVGGMVFGREGAKDQINANIEMMHAQNAFNAEQASTQRDWAAGETQINRQFQERMSNSAVTRRMADLERAGINPILAGKYDASSPAGSVLGGPHATSSGLPNIPNVATSAIAGLEASRKRRETQENLKNIKAQREKVEAETGFIKAKTGIADLPEWISKALSSVAKEWFGTKGSQGASSRDFLDKIKPKPLELTADKPYDINNSAYSRYKLKGVKPQQRKPFQFGRKNNVIH